jgi:hypothetical protein
VLAFGGERGALVWAVVPSRALLDLHAGVAAALDLPGDSHHAPGRWTPHLSLALRATPDERAAAVALLAGLPEVDRRVHRGPQSTTGQTRTTRGPPGRSTGAPPGRSPADRDPPRPGQPRPGREPGEGRTLRHARPFSSRSGRAPAADTARRHDGAAHHAKEPPWSPLSRRVLFGYRAAVPALAVLAPSASSPPMTLITAGLLCVACTRRHRYAVPPAGR